jgi:DNA invertase Pin-like site-specific DNA recombinase
MEAKQTKVYKTAIYLRISREDEHLGESCAITNQREFLTAFVNSRDDLELTAEFNDDGYGGYDFNRPHFQAMLAEVKSGGIDCIVIKDLSRLGRNFLKVEYVKSF